MTKLTEFLSQVKSRAEKATPGPWSKGGTGTIICDVAGDIHHDVIAREDKGPRYVRDEDNREFIAHSRQDVETLLALIEKLMGQRDHWRLEVVKSRAALSAWELSDDAELEKIVEGK